MRLLILIFALAVLTTSGVSQTVKSPIDLDIVVRKEADSVVLPWDMLGDQLLYVKWTPAKIPAREKRDQLLFNHFCKMDSGGQIIFRTHYYDYKGTLPALQLVLGWQEIIKTPCGAIKPWVRGQTYHILAFWRAVVIRGVNKTEVGIFLDGQLVGHKVLQPLVFNPRWFPLRFGAETVNLCGEPTFPSECHIDGHARIILTKFRDIPKLFSFMHSRHSVYLARANLLPDPLKPGG